MGEGVVEVGVEGLFCQGEHLLELDGLGKEENLEAKGGQGRKGGE